LVEDVSLFHGNLAVVHHGARVTTTFRAPGQPLAVGERAYEVREPDAARRPDGAAGDAAEGVAICHVPQGPLAYANTPPGGERRTRSTLDVTVEVGGLSDPWDEVVSLVHSDDTAEGGDHFVVETDELGRSLLRFGNGVNGRRLPEGAAVVATYQIGFGTDGNVGADALVAFDPALADAIAATWNPFDVTDGRAPEPVAEILRRVPEAYRARQLRAVTLADYVERAREVEGVAAAAARYVWTGSWRSVRVTIDPEGTTVLSAELFDRVSRHLEAVRLIGEDLEIRPPRFVPLDIVLSVCIHPDYWPEDIRFFLEQEFSDGYTADGRQAFFHPDRWTFGQELRASQIVGRAQAIQGVDHVTELTMRRRNETTPGTPDRIVVGPSEIILVKNDRDSMEDGAIRFRIGGGRG
jgi:predicted phage baseplate assembly protein